MPQLAVQVAGAGPREKLLRVWIRRGAGRGVTRRRGAGRIGGGASWEFQYLSLPQELAEVPKQSSDDDLTSLPLLQGGLHSWAQLDSELLSASGGLAGAWR